MKQTVTDGMLFFAVKKDPDQNVDGWLDEHLATGDREALLQRLDLVMREKVMRAIEENDMSQRIAYECKGQIRDRVKGTVAARVMTEDKIETLSDYLGRYLQHYIRVHTDDLIMPIVKEEVDSVLTQPVGSLLNEMGVSKGMLKSVAENVYDEFIEKYGLAMAAEFDIAGLTERKIISFRAEEIEALVNRTIKREMQAVVNLGGVLGVIIGFVAALL